MTLLVDERDFLCDCCHWVVDGDERTPIQITAPGPSWWTLDLCAMCWMDHQAQLHHEVLWRFEANACHRYRLTG